MLPRDGDAAVHLGVEVGAQVGGRCRQRGRDRSGVGQLVFADLGGHRRIPHRTGRELGGHAHVGAVVLHRLVHGDRPTELDPLLRVGRRRLGALEGHAHRLRREEEPVAIDERLTGAGDHGARHTVERDAGGAAGGVEVLGRLDRHAVAHLHDGDVVSGEHQQHLGEPAAQHGAQGAGDLTVGDGDRAVEGDRTEARAVGEAREVLGLRGVVGHGVERGARDHGRHERAGRHRPSQLLDDHHELFQPVARAAVLLGEVEPQPAQLHEVAPERGQLLGFGLQQRAGGAAGLPLGQEVRRGLGQRTVVIGDGDRHGSPWSGAAPSKAAIRRR